MNELNHTQVNVRGLEFKLFSYNRSLELCARMNYETENLDFIDDLPKDAVLYDLGACEGRFTIYGLLRGLRVFSFEPDKNNYSVLMDNLRLNNLYNPGAVFNIGIGEKDGEAVLQIGQPWPGGHQKVVKHDSVRSDLNFNFVASEVIKIVGLDSFIASGKAPFPDALKIDIDGSEVPFLKGAKATLKNKQLKKIIFELDKKDDNFNYIQKFLSEAGFTSGAEFKVPNEPTLYNIIYER